MANEGFKDADFHLVFLKKKCGKLPLQFLPQALMASSQNLLTSPQSLCHTKKFQTQMCPDILNRS